MDLRSLGDLLVAAAAITPAAWDALLAEVPGAGESVVRAQLLQVLQTHERAVCAVLAARTGAPVIVLDESTLDLAALDLVPEEVAATSGALPVFVEGDVVTLAVPAENDALSRQLAAITGRTVMLVAAIPELLDATATLARMLRAQGEATLAGGNSSSAAPCLALVRPPTTSASPAADDVARALGDLLAAALEEPAVGTGPGSAAKPATVVESASRTSPTSPSRKLGAVKLKQVARAVPSLASSSAPASASAPSASAPSASAPSASAPSASAPSASAPSASASGAAAALSGAIVGLLPASATTEFEARDLVELPPVPPGAGPRVVVVEDDDAIRALLVRVLTADGLVLESAADGRTALALMRRRRPDLVILDAMLPEIHGFEICAAIKKSDAWSSIPVLMISAVFRGFDNARTIQEVHGADVFLEKPFDLRHLRHVVADLLQRPQPDEPRDVEAAVVAERARALVAEHQASGDVQKTIEALRQWLDADPFQPDAWVMLGQAHAQRADGLSALHAFERAATFGRAHFPAQLALATTYESFGFVRRARAVWARAAACAPDDEAAAKIRAALAAWQRA